MRDIITNFSFYLNWILAIIAVVVGFIAIVQSLKSKFKSYIMKFISDAEKETDLTNTQKMDMVISWIKCLIPLRIFRVVFSDAVLEEIAESVYDDMKQYRKNYIKTHNLVKKKNNEE